MEILAGLITLKDSNKIPLPWYNRPAISMRSGATVWVSRVTSNLRVDEPCPPPDILISPLEPSRFRNIRAITIDLPEQAGAIGEIIAVISQTCNIDLMETVTIDQRTKHRMTFVVQPKRSIQDHDDFDEEKFFQELIKSVLRVEGALFQGQVVMARSDLSFPGPKRKNVRDLYVSVSEIQDNIRNSKEDYSNYDFNRVVISSNTESRFIRCIFPKKGAFELRVTHLDRPEALKNISQALYHLGYNVLLSRVSKISVPNGESSFESETVLICEPIDAIQQIDDWHKKSPRLRRNILNLLDERDPKGTYSFDVSERGVTSGRLCDTTLRPIDPDRSKKIVRVPVTSETALSKIKATRRQRVFVSMRGSFRHSGALRSLWEAAKEAAEASNLLLVDGFSSEPDKVGKVTPDVIYARIWSCDAAIFLAADQNGKAWLTESQLMEW